MIFYVPDLYEETTILIDRALSVDVNRTRLLEVVATIMAMIGCLSVPTLLRRTHLDVLDILRPAESATRRLIAILAHGLIVPERRQSAAPTGKRAKGKGDHAPGFPLFDPRRKVDPKPKGARGYPNVRSLDGSDDAPPAVQKTHSDDPVNAERLCNRIRAMMTALDDLQGHARRLARAMARKTLPIRAMRPGRPPGYRARWRHAVDEILSDCHQLALMVLNEPVADRHHPP